MKILIAALRVPELPLRNGYDVHVYHLLDQLGQHHDIHVLSAQTPAQPLDLKVTWHAYAETNGTSTPLSGLATRTQRHAVAMAPHLEPLLRSLRPDVVHVISGRLAPLGQLLTEYPSVLGALDASHLNSRARMKNAGIRFPRALAAYFMTVHMIKTAYLDFSTVAVVSDGDAAALHGLVPEMKTRAIPNGVDVADYAFVEGTERHPNELLFTGALNYPPNEHAVELLASEILPLVQKEVPEAHLRLVGRDPSERVKALASRTGIEIVADVPTMAPYLSHASVFVCPMTSGTGIKNKLLEALANGLACVTTPLALQGIEAKPNHHVLVGADGAAIAKETARALRDADLRARLGTAGRDLVERNHTWRMVAEQYTQLYEDVSSRP